MSLILGSERLLYDRRILEAKLKVADFDITRESEASGAKPRQGTGTVTVTYKPTGISRQYRDGVYPPPYLEFERDLKTNVFDTQ